MPYRQSHIISYINIPCRKIIPLALHLLQFTFPKFISSPKNGNIPKPPTKLKDAPVLKNELFEFELF